MRGRKLPLLSLASSHSRAAAPGAPAAQRKRVLLVSYRLPPSTIALRVRLLAHYLPQFGWDATLLTQATHAVDAPTGASRDFITVPQLFERFLSAQGGGRISSLARSVARKLLFPDSAAGWIPTATMRALALTRRQTFDAIISTCPPASAHVVAGVVAARRHLPWIADYRECWSNGISRGGGVRARLEFELERVLRGRAAIVTTADADLFSRQERVFGQSFGETVPSTDGKDGTRYVAQRFAVLLDSVTEQGPRIFYIPD